mmetsp:Transcript_127599/g.369396  ORF Transcript_127599/g.369396 Transcript_127599/m.369396 type:complete len:223 (-) Transcript_127599:1961-2629(-)
MRLGFVRLQALHLLPGWPGRYVPADCNVDHRHGRRQRSTGETSRPCGRGSDAQRREALLLHGSFLEVSGVEDRRQHQEYSSGGPLVRWADGAERPGGCQNAVVDVHERRGLRRPLPADPGRGGVSQVRLDCEGRPRRSVLPAHLEDAAGVAQGAGGCASLHPKPRLQFQVPGCPRGLLSRGFAVVLQEGRGLRRQGCRDVSEGRRELYGAALHGGRRRDWHR